MSPKGRHAKSKARINAYEELLGKNLEKESGTREIFIAPGPRLGDLVIEAQSVNKAFGEKLLVEGMTFSLPPGGIVGVIGPNGAGKTTLFRMITGQEKPDAGTIRIGETVKPAYVDQSRDALDPDKNIWEIAALSTHENYRRKHIGESLVKFATNKLLKEQLIPRYHVHAKNIASYNLAIKCGYEPFLSFNHYKYEKKT
ncbi:MAG: putative ABC transporter ATP-binding protein YjjK [Deltaproteobacteria bacterium ADurb.Bin151]|nr:MAG: putative ABC transporter ATP-binding protein YjjK [Deltaproteobacteria bacterium ADurb.Bin151]